MTDEQSNIWVAGLIDAEGCLGLEYKDPRVGIKAHATITNLNFELIQLIKTRMGFGGIFSQPIKSGKIIYHWKVSRGDMRELLTRITPYLVIKKLRADILMRILDTIKGPGIKPSERDLILRAALVDIWDKQIINKGNQY